MTFAQIQAFILSSPATVFYACGFAGMVAHYAKKWTRGEINLSLFEYMVKDNPKASVAAVCTCLGATTAIVATGTLHGMDIPTVAALGFTTGFAIDSAVNKTGDGK
jgi:hypothetical protein